MKAGEIRRHGQHVAALAQLAQGLKQASPNLLRS
jgi:hypothetical protein